MQYGLLALFFWVVGTQLGPFPDYPFLGGKKSTSHSKIPISAHHRS